MELCVWGTVLIGVSPTVNSCHRDLKNSRLNRIHLLLFYMKEIYCRQFRCYGPQEPRVHLALLYAAVFQMWSSSLRSKMNSRHHIRVSSRRMEETKGTSQVYLKEISQNRPHNNSTHPVGQDRVLWPCLAPGDVGICFYLKSKF